MNRLQELQHIKTACYALVRKRALVSAGAAIVPVPLLDVVVDVGNLMQLIPEINRRFGLEPEGLAQLPAQEREKISSLIRTRGSELIGIVVTREIVRRTFLGFAGKMATKQLTKFIPFGGQMVAAGLAYFVLRKIAHKHIEDCYAVASAMG